MEETVVSIRRGTTPKLHHGRLKPTAAVARHFTAEIPSGTDVEVVREPTYWAHHCKVVQPMDQITCFWEDGSLEIWYRVMFVAPGEIKLSEILRIAHDKIEEPEVEGEFEVAWISPPVKFAVRRRDDKTVIKDGLYPREQAVKYLHDHLKKRA